MLYMPEIRFRQGLCPGPRWGSSRRSPRLPSRLGRGIPLPIPHLPRRLYGVSISASRISFPESWQPYDSFRQVAVSQKWQKIGFSSRLLLITNGKSLMHFQLVLITEVTFMVLNEPESVNGHYMFFWRSHKLE